MELHYGNLYWNKTKDQEVKFDKVRENIKTQVLVVGGGMSGNLCANTLAKEGYRVSLVEKNRIGGGSSAANTGLLQYTSDVMMHELAGDIGEKDAYLFYKMCLEAMEDLTALSMELDESLGFRNRNSIYYASTFRDKKRLKDEYRLLNKYNFPVEYLSRRKLKAQFGLDKPNALRTWHDADVNPYKFILSLSKQNTSLGVTYYEDTKLDLDKISENKIKTKDSYEIEFDYIVIATGYSHIYPPIKDKFQMYRTYAFATRPIKGPLWPGEAMFWETKNPYIYFRTTKDNRVVGGGLDKKSKRVEKSQSSIDRKNKNLIKEIQGMFSNLNLELEYSWNALFGASKDGIPFIGSDPLYKNKLYLLGYEGNGTAYSMAGSKIILDLIRGKNNKYSHIVRVDR